MRKSKYPSLGIMDFLERLAFGGVPKFGRDSFYEEIRKTQPLERPVFSKKIYLLKQQGFIDYLSNREFILTKKGLQKINFLRLEKLSLFSKKWDGLWRLIIFDIPERYKTARNLFRDKLIEFKCSKLQKSVYVTPLVCEKEIKEATKILGIGQYIQIIFAKSLGDKEEKLRRYYRKMFPLLKRSF